MRNFLIYICESPKTKRYNYVLSKMIELGDTQQISKQLFLYSTKEDVRDINDIIQDLTRDLCVDVFIVAELNNKSMQWNFRDAKRQETVNLYFDNLPEENINK